MRRLVRGLGDAYWPLPALCVAVSAGVALGLVQVDEVLEREGLRFAFTGGPDSARSLLSTIASSMLSLAALVFSITIVVLQLASTQFSPRVLRTFLRDRRNQFALGVFLGTFVYALVALREVRGQDGLVGRFVPGITITVGFALVILSVGLFVQYIHHIAQSIRLVTIIDRIAEETRGCIDRVQSWEAEGASPAPPPPALGPATTVFARAHGSVTSVDVDGLVAAASAAGGVVRLVPCVGDFVAEGMPLAEVTGGTEVEEAVHDAVELGRERSSDLEVAFGLRQLVDVAERALSPGVNDPSTAVQCLDQLHDLLRRLAVRPEAPTVHRDGAGAVRAVIPLPIFADHVGLALDEIRHWGGSSLQVRRRIEGLLDDLLTVAEGDRRRPLLERIPPFSEPLGPP